MFCSSDMYSQMEFQLRTFSILLCFEAVFKYNHSFHSVVVVLEFRLFISSSCVQSHTHCKTDSALNLPASARSGQNTVR